MSFLHAKHIYPHAKSPKVLTHSSINSKPQISSKYHLNQVLGETQGIHPEAEFLSGYGPVETKQIIYF